MQYSKFPQEAYNDLRIKLYGFLYDAEHPDDR